jgi:hypothetical protein
MSTQTVYGFAKTASSSFPLKATITDGSDNQELTTNTDFTITAQSLGTIAEGQMLTHLSVTSATGICYAGVLRNGQYIALCQSLGSQSLGGQVKYLPILPAPFKLVAGDQIIVRTEA